MKRLNLAQTLTAAMLRLVCLIDVKNSYVVHSTNKN